MHPDRYIDHLIKIFEAAPDKHEAHVRSAPLLADMSGDADFLTTALAQHLRRPGVLNTRNYPVVGVDVKLNEWFHVVINGWIPRADHVATISSKAIHHHGDLLLTSATMTGPGYEHWLFTRPRPLEPESGLYHLDVTDKRWHPAHHLVFVDAHIPHMPWYPPDTTLTLCLWSDQRPTTWRDRVKRIPVLKKNEARLRALVRAVGATRVLAKTMGLKPFEALDFYPDQDGFHVLPVRQEFERGPNADHLHSLFHILQRTKNEGLARIVEERLQAEPQLDSRPLVEQLLRQLREGRPIDGRLSGCHYELAHAMFPQTDVERALAAQSRRH